jgi:hypothetical protein
MNLENVPEQYLLVVSCEEDGYWDTSGYCHWSKPAVHLESTFDLNDEEDLIKAIGCFKEEYPNGDYEIYVVKNFDCYEHEEQKEYLLQLCYKGEDLAKEIAKEKIRLEKEKKDKELVRQQEAQKERDLKLLNELKEKYENKL